MFYVSRVTPLFFFLGFFDFIFALISRFLNYDHIDLALIAVFGFVLHTILGAAYQIIPNSQQETLKYPKVSYFVLLLSFLSSIGLYLREFSFASTVSFISVLIFTVHVSTVIKNI